MLRSFCVGFLLEFKWRATVILKNDDGVKGKSVEQDAKPQVQVGNRGWEKLPVGGSPSVAGDSTSSPPAKKNLSVDANVIIHAAQGKLGDHPTVQRLISQYKLVVTTTVAREIIDKDSRLYLSEHCEVKPATRRATELTRGYCAELKSGKKNVPSWILFTGNEEIDLSCYLDACMRGLPHLTLDRNFVNKLMFRHEKFASYAEEHGVELSTLYIGVKGKTSAVKVHNKYPDDNTLEREAKFVKVLRDK